MQLLSIDSLKIFFVAIAQIVAVWARPTKHKRSLLLRPWPPQYRRSSRQHSSPPICRRVGNPEARPLRNNARSSLPCRYLSQAHELVARCDTCWHQGSIGQYERHCR